MKKVLIISPHFAPLNAADMHRIRQSIDSYSDYGWSAELVVVDDKYVNITRDELLLKSISSNTIIHKVKAFGINYTRLFGLGNIAYRSMYYYYKYINALLSKNKFDLIFFSTTAFPICVLGRLWKKRFGVPYIIDMQDPWRSDHYLTVPKKQRPPKFWVSFILDSVLEKFSMSRVDGLMSVSQKYIDVLINRYVRLKNIPVAVIPFAAYKNDIEIVKSASITNNYFQINDSVFNIVYIGRAGFDMVLANSIFLKAIKTGRIQHNEFNKIRVYFIGTSYDSNGLKTVEPIANELGLKDFVFEFTNRIPYYQSLKLLMDANFLFVPGSDNIGYTASKIYSYVWLNKPLLTLFHSSSTVNDFMNDCNAGLALQFDEENEEIIIEKIINYLKLSMSNNLINNINWNNFDKYTSSSKVKLQTDFFNRVIKL